MSVFHLLHPSTLRESRRTFQRRAFRRVRWEPLFGARLNQIAILLAAVQ